MASGDVGYSFSSELNYVNVGEFVSKPGSFSLDLIAHWYQILVFQHLNLDKS